ncbi:Nramp family divalent metal transporter [Caproiciproducens galactitolivorans]|uniref:Divalent metal cation transporter MntH n=2 Tax=Caproiciproducens galactitolivorans TaxID=642589 RepID=A0ABT4BV26_9FIRM|nr:Nramp family divalent metal transporter [Caproiciproducens galactitolivorans]MCY1714737.1 Nramp family divalent metal transporter [Caproiciproducens galactitolivorans]
MQMEEGAVQAGLGSLNTAGTIKKPSLRVPNKFLQLLKYLGPAFVVSVAYIDPGNFATNISGGSKFNYTLIWVILASNLMAIFLQTMSAKVGIATGHSLPEMCAKVFSRRVNVLFWIVAELGAMATDLAEFLGGTLGLNLLFGIPMPVAGLLTGLLTYLICAMERYGQKAVEIIITVLVAVISVAYLTEIFLAKPDWAQVGIHTFVPSLPNGEAVTIAVGMLGATVMPHVIYLHSQLVQCRCGGGDCGREKRHHLKMEKIDIAIAMNIAFFVNAGMVVVSAAVFFRSGMVVETMQEAHKSLEPLLGPLSSGAFGVALLASGLSSSAVGTMAGQTIMKGFINLSIPVNLRRLITMLPALIIIILGVNPMNVLVLSQVALSFILPVPIIQMLSIAKRRDLMGEFANTTRVRILGMGIAAVIIALNAVLLYLTFAGLS